MTVQASLFPEVEEKPYSADSADSAMPEGFRYERDLISPDEEAALAAEIAQLTLAPYEFRGFLANRMVTAFGFRYDYKRRKLLKAPGMPPFLADIRAKVALFAGRPPEDFRQVLVTEYVPGTAINWHRDRPQYGEIAGVSLLSPATFRVRRRDGDRWLRASQTIEARSVYLMSGEVRTAWEHSIPPVEALRYSLTFRTLAEGFKPQDD